MQLRYYILGLIIIFAFWQLIFGGSKKPQSPEPIETSTGTDGN